MLPILGRDDDVSGAAVGRRPRPHRHARPRHRRRGRGRSSRPTHAVIAHVSGSAGLHPLARHPRRAVLHPLVALPDAERGAERLVGAWFGIAEDGDPLVAEVVASLRGRVVHVAETEWARYHAAAVIASNHLVALLGQAERVAASVGAPVEAFLDLARGSLADVAALGPRAALTGPVRRGDTATVARHLDALPPEERAAYEAMAARGGPPVPVTTVTTIAALRERLDARARRRAARRVRADDGLPPRRPRVAHGGGPRRHRPRGGVDLREPAAVRARPRTSTPTPATSPGTPTLAEARGGRPPVRAVGRGDVPGRRRPHHGDGGGGVRHRWRGAPGPRTSRASPPWSPSCSPSSVRAAPTSARRTSSRSRSSARWCSDLSMPVDVVALPHAARARRPRPVEPQRLPHRRGAGRGARRARGAARRVASPSTPASATPAGCAP